MTTQTAGALRGTQMGSANFEFKSKYLRTLELAILIAIAVHVIAIFTVPPFELTPYTLKEKEMVAINEDSGGSDSFYAFDSPPVPIKKEAPAYPELARAAGAAGTVQVEVTVDKNGRVKDARVVASDTITSLEEAAKAAAMKWLFTPAKQRDVPVVARIVIPFEFKLH
jgi:TonB family protein